MKRTILISLAAGVAIVPAMLGVASASNGHGADDRSGTPSASASSTVDDRGRGGHGADDTASAVPTSSAPTTSATVDDRNRDRGADDPATSASPSSSVSSADDRGRGSDDATTASPTRSATSAATSRTTSSTATASATVDDKGHGVEVGDDSGGHGGKSGKN